MKKKEVTQTMTTMSVQAVNKEMEEILHHDSTNDSTNNTLHGAVCLVCDKLMKRKERCKISLKTFLKSYAPNLKGDDDVPDPLRQCCKFSVPDDEEANRVLSECLLSPRAKVVHAGEKRKGSAKVMCCQECKSGLAPRKLRKGELPRFAVANGMAIGTPPPCIERLNEIELALISQARFRGHLFTYWGGCHRSIKEWHSFYEVDPSHSTAVLGEACMYVNCPPVSRWWNIQSVLLLHGKAIHHWMHHKVVQEIGSLVQPAAQLLQFSHQGLLLNNHCYLPLLSFVASEATKTNAASSEGGRGWSVARATAIITSKMLARFRALAQNQAREWRMGTQGLYRPGVPSSPCSSTGFACLRF